SAGGSVARADQSLDPGRLDRHSQALAQLDRRLPAEQLPGAGDLGLAYLRVVGGPRLVDDFRARFGHLDHDLSQLEQGELVGVADVDRLMDLRLGHRYVAADLV